MEFGIRIVKEIPWYYVGLDRGKIRDYSALAVVERAEIFLDEMDWATYEKRQALRYRVKFLQRVQLGTPYPNVVDRVREVVRNGLLSGRCTLVMDATGVGAPVLDLLRQADLGCEIEAVIMTGGEQESSGRGAWRVPKKDLVVGLRLMLETRELGLSRRAAVVEVFAKELADMASRLSGSGRESFGASRAGEHDDLVVATALACWRARRKRHDMCGKESLGLF